MPTIIIFLREMCLNVSNNFNSSANFMKKAVTHNSRNHPPKAAEILPVLTENSAKGK